MENLTEIFAFVTGVIYIILEIRQKNFMWIIGILTGVTSTILFFRQGLYASMSLNIYYVCVSAWGLYAWRRDSRAMSIKTENDGNDAAAERIHLNRLSLKMIIGSSLTMIVGTAAFVCFLRWLNDPMSLLDASVTILSAIATFWLSRSYMEQWLLWIVANILTAAMCLSQELNLLTILYGLYSLAAVYGYCHWRKYGEYLS